VSFDYRIVAKRSGYENVRLADVTEKYKRLQAQRDARFAPQHRAQTSANVAPAPENRAVQQTPQSSQPLTLRKPQITQASK
jgi:hypothetical protein